MKKNNKKENYWLKAEKHLTVLQFFANILPT